MPVGFRVQGVAAHEGNKIYEVDVHPFESFNEKHSGLVTLTKELDNFTPNLIPFLNDTLGNQMNQNVTFGGTPELIHDGQAVGVWTPTANAGTWNFADAGKITITSAENNDSATFDDAGTIDMSGYVAITGKVDLDLYNPANHSILIQFGLAGVAVGNFVNLNDYIDTGIFTEQSFAIPKEDLGIDTLTVDEMTITMFRGGGSKPIVKFDDLQIEQTGSPAAFKVFSGRESDFHTKKVQFTFVDDYTGISTVAGATENATMTQLSYNKILGVDALPVGIVVQIVRDGEVDASFTLRQLSDFHGIGARVVQPLIADGTNAMMVMELEFSAPVVLKANNQNNSYISVTINDDLSGLVLFTGIARGKYEVI
jgi:hypothetical protein